MESQNSFIGIAFSGKRNCCSCLQKTSQLAFPFRSHIFWLNVISLAESALRMKAYIFSPSLRFISSFVGAFSQGNPICEQVQFNSISVEGQNYPFVVPTPLDYVQVAYLPWRRALKCPELLKY